MPTTTFPDPELLWTLDEGRVAVEEWQRSGESIIAFTRRHGMTPSRLYWWRHRVREANQAGQGSAGRGASLTLVPAAVTSAPSSAATVSLRLRDGLVVEITDASPTWIAAMVVELERSRP